MYRHVAESIKETSTRNFITQIEKDKFNNYENIMRRKDDSYSKTEVENKIKELSDATYGTVEADYVSEYNTLDGYVKDLELYGNTIQNQDNLEDIKSVGKLQEDGTYKMSIVSCGENLFDGEWIEGYAIWLGNDGGGKTYGEVYNNDTHSTSKNFIKVIPNEIIHFIKTGHQKWVMFYDINKNPISNIEVWSNCTVPSNAYYIRFYDNKSRVENYSNYTVSFKEFLSYEPYQESRVDINLPCQLQKIGNVSDRLYYDNEEKAWCIEKNIEKKIFTGSDNEEWALKPFYAGNDKQYYGTPNHGYTFKEAGGISEFPVYSSGELTRDHNGIAMTCSKTWGTIDYSVDIATLSEFKSWVKGKYIYVVPETPQKIILPLDIQIQLNSYANKTHIYTVSGEVEPTIKATLPKSLGASVQTLNDKTDMMIDRIKNVETLKEGQGISYESDKGFVLCENTNNGQIDNIKIEGKTLVNIHPKQTYNFNTSEGNDGKYTIIKDINYLKVNITSKIEGWWFINLGLLDMSLIKPNTKYTILFDKSTNLQGVRFMDNGATVCLSVKDGYIKNNMTVIETTNFTKDHISGKSMYLYGLMANVESQLIEVQNAIILEGDYTQNPPSYFEGLMSVGGDIDEMTIRNVNKNLISREDIEQGGYTWARGELHNSTDRCRTSVPIEVKYGQTLYRNKKCVYFLYNEDNKYIGNGTVGNFNTSAYVDIPYVVQKGVRYIKIVFSGSEHGVDPLNSNYDDTIFSFSPISDYKPHKSHTKSLLYYNESGELVPVTELHEWDSIEKHSDGKWYYHKRSGKIVLNGSENWALGAASNSVVIELWGGTVLDEAYGGKSEEFICDILPKFNGNTNSEYINLYNTSNANKAVAIKLSTQKATDLQTGRQWLQANNVTVVYQLAQEKVYECVNLNLDTYDNETMVMVNTGAITPNLSFNVSSHIGNTVSILRERLKQIEEAFTKDKISQNTFQLNTMYSSDKLVFNVNIYACSINEYDEDLFTLITEVLLAGKDNYNLAKMEEIIDFYTMIGKLSFDMADVLFEMIENQINPPVIEIPEEEIEILPEI